MDELLFPQGARLTRPSIGSVPGLVHLPLRKLRLCYYRRAITDERKRRTASSVTRTS